MKTSEFASHLIFDKLAQLELRVHSAEMQEKADLEILDFMKASCGFIRSQLDKSLSVLINPSDLGAVATEVENALNQLNEFLGSGNAGNINNAVNYLYSAIARAKGFPLPSLDGQFSY